MPKKGVKKDTISALKQNEEKNKKKEENQNIDEYSDKSDEEEYALPDPNLPQKHFDQKQE